MARGRSTTSRGGMAVRMLRSNALSRGVFGGSKPWLAVAGVIYGGKAVRKTLGRQTGVIWSGRLVEGETVTVNIRTPRKKAGRGRAQAS